MGAILERATEVARTVADPDAAAYEVEQVQRETSVRVAEAQTAQAGAERVAREERRRAEQEVEQRAQADPGRGAQGGVVLRRRRVGRTTKMLQQLVRKRSIPDNQTWPILRRALRRSGGWSDGRQHAEPLGGAHGAHPVVTPEAGVDVREVLVHGALGHR
jgi:hypothetical protein